MSNNNYVEIKFEGFGWRELREALKLLTAYLEKDNTRLFSGQADVTIGFNMNSGYVFLIDDEYNCAMLNGDNLEDWIVCPECGEENFMSEFEAEKECCIEFLKDMKERS
jgi:hypothetical protein